MSFVRALKVWWSYAWRTLLLWLPFTAAAMVAGYAFLPWEKIGAHILPPAPEHVPALALRIFALFLLWVASAVAVQTAAIRWMLKVRWSDFRLVAAPRDVD